MVKADDYVPERGDIVWITLNPRIGHEQSGRRPAVIISPSSYNFKANLALTCPITNRVKGYPFEVVLPSKMIITGAVLTDQLRSLNWREREALFITKLPDKALEKIIERIEAFIFCR